MEARPLCEGPVAIICFHETDGHRTAGISIPDMRQSTA
jgi:hypothetical protein